MLLGPVIFYKNKFLSYESYFNFYQLFQSNSSYDHLLIDFLTFFITNKKNNSVLLLPIKQQKNTRSYKRGPAKFFYWRNVSGFLRKFLKKKTISKTFKNSLYTGKKPHFIFLNRLKNNFFFIVGNLISPYFTDLEVKKTRRSEFQKTKFFIKKFSIKNANKVPFQISFFKNNSKVKFTNFKYLFRTLRLKTKLIGRLARYPLKPYSIFKTFKPNFNKNPSKILKLTFFYKKQKKVYRNFGYLFKRFKNKLFFKKQNFIAKKKKQLSKSTFRFFLKKRRVTFRFKNRNFFYPQKKYPCFIKRKHPLRLFKNQTRRLRRKPLRIFLFTIKKLNFFKIKFLTKRLNIKKLINQKKTPLLLYTPESLGFKTNLNRNYGFQDMSSITFFTKRKPLKSFKNYRTTHKSFKKMFDLPLLFKCSIRKPWVYFISRTEIKSTVLDIFNGISGSLNIFLLSNKPFVNNRSMSKFILDLSGFLLVTKNFSLSLGFKKFTSDIKKKNYSFAVRNELQKFIIRKYAKEASIFMSLNRYKINERTNLFGSALKNTESSLFLSSFSTLTQKEHSRTPALFRSFSSYKTKNRVLNTIRENAPYKNYNPTIRKIKFKPGYMTIWREARSVLKQLWNLNFRYQYRLTGYLTKFFKLLKVNLLLADEMRFKSILIRSRIFTDIQAVQYFIDSGIFYINGVICKNPKFQLHSGDFIQMLLSTKYYIAHKWFAHWIGKKKLKLKIRTRKKLLISFSDEEKIRTKTYPLWILNYKNFFQDTPPFIELDFLTLSFFVIYEPTCISDVDTDAFIWNKYSITNMYNWKYIN